MTELPTRVREMAEAAQNRSERTITLPVSDVLALCPDDAEGRITAVALRHGINLHPRIARDIAAGLYRQSA
jgi:hypothetical protein